MLKTLMYTLMHVDNPYSTATCANPMLDLLGKHEKKTMYIYIYIPNSAKIRNGAWMLAGIARLQDL